MREDRSLVASSDASQSVSAQLARASAKVAGFLEVGLQGAANTERAYTSDLKSYAAFCEQHGLQAVLVDVNLLTGYVAPLASGKPEPAVEGGRQWAQASRRLPGRTCWRPCSGTRPPSAKPTYYCPFYLDHLSAGRCAPHDPGRRCGQFRED